ncbi:hypothetical protein AVEN_116933-1 [Araneus ventricosus]|uniref:Uncharacterized protein n=1 Tax=Araneus ventricosus TaxID=182803 RepID=A0A4Y2RUT2_ARAVE|nr:hypothetical protein AVEN_116933-1 [Araneus ventricosus]
MRLHQIVSYRVHKEGTSLTIGKDETFPKGFRGTTFSSLLLKVPTNIISSAIQILLKSGFKKVPTSRLGELSRECIRFVSLHTGDEMNTNFPKASKAMEEIEVNE